MKFINPEDDMYSKLVHSRDCASLAIVFVHFCFQWKALATGELYSGIICLFIIIFSSSSSSKQLWKSAAKLYLLQIYKVPLTPP